MPTPLVVAITGLRGHGKTTAAQTLEKLGWRHLNFADTLKETVQLVYGIPLDVQNDPVLKEEVWPYFPNKSPRELLQIIGTELFRSYIDGTWIEAWKRRCTGFSHIVCSDLRYQNEADLVDDMGGLIIRVTNPSIIRADQASQHLSETSIQDIEVDFEVVNDGSIADLQAQISAIVALHG